jgi:TonB family protein
MHPLLRCGASWLVLGSAFLSPLAAQSVLLAEYKDKLHVVQRAAGSRPYVEVDGKLIPANGDRFALREVPEYLPAFISTRNIRARTTALQFADSGSQINNQFEFYGEFSSEYRLDNVFLVLELNLEDGSKSLFLREIGRLEPRDSRPLSVAVRTAYPLGAGHFTMHLFVNGLEVFHSGQPFTLRERALDKMVAKRIEGCTNSPPTLFVGTPPEYPAKLEKAKVSGRALVRLRVQPNGAVADPSVVEATDPAFGEAALAAVRQWRFLPRVKDGRPVAATVSMPLNFEPAGKPAPVK